MRLLSLILLLVPFAAAGDDGLRARFATVDTDGNGVIDRGEFRRFMLARAPQSASTGASVRASPQFREADRDGDGYLTEGELWSAPLPQSGGWTAMDLDGDGRISPSEYTPVR